MPEPSMHPDGRGRAVASSYSGAQLYTGYRVRLGELPGPIGIIRRIEPSERVEVEWPDGSVTLHPARHLRRVGSVRENEYHPEVRAGYPRAHAPREEEQRWVELTRSQVEDLLSMTQDRLSAITSIIVPDEARRAYDNGTQDAELRARKSELLVLKGMLLLGRDDPGAPR